MPFENSPGHAAYFPIQYVPAFRFSASYILQGRQRVDKEPVGREPWRAAALRRETGFHATAAFSQWGSTEHSEKFRLEFLVSCCSKTTLSESCKDFARSALIEYLRIYGKIWICNKWGFILWGMHQLRVAKGFCDKKFKERKISYIT